MAEAAKRAETLGKKRKHQTHEAGTSKKVKVSDGSEKSKKKNEDTLTPVSQNMTVKSSPGKALKGKDKTDKQNKVKKGDSVKRTPVKSKKEDGVIEINDSSDEEVSLAKIKAKCAGQNEDSDFDVPLASLTNHQVPKKKKFKKLSLDGRMASHEGRHTKKTLNKNSQKKSPALQKPKKLVNNQKTPTKRKRRDSSDSDVPLSKFFSPKKTPGTPKSKTSSPAKKMKEKNEHTPRKEQKTSEKSPEKKVRCKPKKGEDNTPSKQGPKKGMKQVTLYELATQKPSKPAVQTPKKSPAKPATPLIVKKLMQLNKEEDKVKFNMLLKKAVLVLTPQQKKNLPSPIKEKLQKKTDIMEEKKKLEKMTDEEREAYFKEKKEKQKQQLKEKLKARMKELRQRYEDQDLNLHPLPAPRLVTMPENLPNELFGDIAMVTEFVSSYSGLLMPDAEYPIYTDALMKAIAGGPQGFAYLSRVLGVLLQTLQQDELAEGYSELRVPLRDIAVNPYTVSELVRLCLRKHDSNDNSSDIAETDDSEVPDSLVQLLETQEFYQLESDQKVALLKGLCLRLMSTYSLQDYMEERQREAIQLTKQRNSEMKEFNEKKRDKKQNKSSQRQSSSSFVHSENSQENSPAITIANFYGKKLDDTSTNDSAIDSQEDDDNLVSIVKRRRLMAAKAAAEKEKRELERRLQREKEHQEERTRREREQFETKFKDSINLARTVLRHIPIGYDRHHNRYWIFTNTTPGLYIEKAGWVSQDISYNPGCVPQEKGRNDDSASSLATSSSTPEKNSSKATHLGPKRKKALVESTIPHSGQNLWFTYPSVKDLDELLKALHPQGIREGALKVELKKRYADICRGITAAQRNNLELRDSDGNVEMIAGFKKELADIELRLRNGGLGGVQNYSSWEAKLMAAEDCVMMGACLLEVQEGILDKFLQGFMKRLKQSDKSDKAEEGDNSDADDEDKKSIKEERSLSAAEQRLQQWKGAVENCSTLSRLHVLLSMMDSCIKWEKSAENAKCKICRKKCDDDRLLLCDECNQAFHMYCLRPALVSVPRGDWYCPACMPQSKRRTQVPKRFADESESDAVSSEEEEGGERSTACQECGGQDEELIQCGSCHSVYHLDCHQPPLRRAPRGSWECSNCKNGFTRQKKRPQRKVAASRKNYCYDDSPPELADGNPRLLNYTSSGGRRSGRLSGGDGYLRTRSSDRHEDLSQHRSRRAPSDLSICEDILQRLMKHPNSWPFLEPVDKKEVPDYYSIIRKPMDFQTMQKKCARLSYSSPQEFVEDAILVFSNAATYNQPNSEVYECMRVMERLFSELLAKYLPGYAITQVFVSDVGDSSTNSARFRRSRRN
ncbi:hypothetical protein C0Q70_04917 [Pomacea canaliculata]|uniref:Tyrosine-protein kinase BAZ1B n=1 Tax=Pomacea canaliculata TaxID=400727 RepID=A0A2T7PJP6_POMCA|nr:hypothetical protein C0Q70_04917 [Pomacea canaliculata]